MAELEDGAGQHERVEVAWVPQISALATGLVSVVMEAVFQRRGHVSRPAVLLQLHDSPLLGRISEGRLEENQESKLLCNLVLKSREVIS